MTSIYTIRDNLKKTIEGKVAAIGEYQNRRWKLLQLEGAGAAMEAHAVYATIEFLRVNIDELRRILADVEVCCEKATEDSWRENPDRMGGQFTQEEIDNADKW
jgi:hypothetical protein